MSCKTLWMEKVWFSVLLVLQKQQSDWGLETPEWKAWHGALESWVTWYKTHPLRKGRMNQGPAALQLHLGAGRSANSCWDGNWQAVNMLLVSEGAFQNPVAQSHTQRFSTMQIPGSHPQSFWFGRLAVGPECLHGFKAPQMIWTSVVFWAHTYWEPLVKEDSGPWYTGLAKENSKDWKVIQSHTGVGVSFHKPPFLYLQENFTW